MEPTIELLLWFTAIGVGVDIALYFGTIHRARERLSHVTENSIPCELKKLWITELMSEAMKNLAFSIMMVPAAWVCYFIFLFFTLMNWVGGGSANMLILTLVFLKMSFSISYFTLLKKFGKVEALTSKSSVKDILTILDASETQKDAITAMLEKFKTVKSVEKRKEIAKIVYNIIQ